MIDKKEAAHRLAQAHFEVEDGMRRAFRLEATNESDAEPIKLLEVNADTIPADRMVPLGFAAAPSRGIPYSSIIVEVTPEEFEKIASQEWRLPNGWRIVEEIAKN